MAILGSLAAAWTKTESMIDIKIIAKITEYVEREDMTKTNYIMAEQMCSARIVPSTNKVFQSTGRL